MEDRRRLFAASFTTLVVAGVGFAIRGAILADWATQFGFTKTELGTITGGVDDLVGGCEIYHHTQPNLLHVRQAREVVTLFDCIYTLDADNPEGPGYLDAETAKRMTENAKSMVARARRILVPTRFVGAEVVMRSAPKLSSVS